MTAIHPNILEHDGQKAFVILPYEEFLIMEEELEQFEDLKQLREAKVEEANATTASVDAVKKELGLYLANLVNIRQRACGKKLWRAKVPSTQA